jgi:hypothetical protein
MLPWAKPTRQRTQTCHGFHCEQRSSRKSSHSPRPAIIHAALGEANKAANPGLPLLPPRTALQPDVAPLHLASNSSTLPWAKPTRQRTQTCHASHHGRCSSWEAVPLTSTYHHPRCLGRSQQGSDPDLPQLPSSTGAPVRMSSRSSWPAIIPPAWGEAKQGSDAEPSSTAIINGASARKSSRSSRHAIIHAARAARSTGSRPPRFIQSQLDSASEPFHGKGLISCIGTSRPSRHRSFAACSRPPNDWRSAARSRRSAATEDLVSCNVRVGRERPARLISFTRHLGRASLVSLPESRA